MIKYKIKEKLKGDVMIEKTGAAIEFTASSVMDHLQELSRKKMELMAQSKLNKAEMTNIEEHNAWLKDLTEEQIHACHMYWESKRLHDACEKKLPEYDAVIQEYKDAIAEIKSQTGTNITKYGKK